MSDIKKNFFKGKTVGRWTLQDGRLVRDKGTLTTMNDTGIVFNFPQDGQTYYFPGPSETCVNSQSSCVNVSGYTTRNVGILFAPSPPTQIQLLQLPAGTGTPPVIETIPQGQINFTPIGGPPASGEDSLGFTANVPAVKAGSFQLTATISTENDSNSIPEVLVGSVNINIVFVST
jgi:hypothetical protein